ncbi:MAG: formylglycine-generating enzyme family protein [Armatimonadota bacterium]
MSARTLAGTFVVMLATAVAASSQERPWERAGTHAGQEVVGPAGIALVWVPGGTFLMGSTKEDFDWVADELGWIPDSYNVEKPAHQVELGGFWLGKTGVTVAQWRAVVGDVPPNNNLGEDHPVVRVSWQDCQEFCSKLGLSLPTEAQWEYAARGPERRQFPWGNEWDRYKCCANGSPANSGRTAPVGSFPDGASWCGALDMAGNVWEWCADWYAGRYYEQSQRQNPTGPDRGSERVLRGGCWIQYYAFCRSAGRYHHDPRIESDRCGFRVVAMPR